MTSNPARLRRGQRARRARTLLGSTRSHQRTLEAAPRVKNHRPAAHPQEAGVCARPGPGRAQVSWTQTVGTGGGGGGGRGAGQRPGCREGRGRQKAPGEYGGGRGVWAAGSVGHGGVWDVGECGLRGVWAAGQCGAPGSVGCGECGLRGVWAVGGGGLCPQPRATIAQNPARVLGRSQTQQYKWLQKPPPPGMSMSSKWASAPSTPQTRLQ